MDADQRPSHVGPPFTGHFKVICDTPRGLQPWQPSADPLILEGKESADTDAKAAASTTAKGDLNLELGRNIYEASAKGKLATKAEPKANGEAPQTNGVGAGDLEKLNKGTPVKVNCQTCGIDCTRVFYHDAQVDPNSKGKSDLCPSCFIEGRFPNNKTSAGYVKMENPTYTTLTDKDAPWSDAEILRLLEGLEKYDDDWNEIAEHVQTRTREECVLQFLQLDIEGKYLDSEPPINGPTGLPMLGTAGGQLPFSQADNPVMSVIGFLASLVDPSTTAAVSNRSIEELKNGLRKKLEISDKENGVAANGKGKDAEAPDSMDVDGRQETAATPKTASDLASIPLASAAARAAGLASHEEREMTRLVSAAVNITLQKMELKLRYFNEMENILQAERRELERGRQQLFLDRLAFKQRVKSTLEGFRSAAQVGGEEGLRIAQAAVAEGERYTFAPPAGTGHVQPLSAEGPIKSFEA